MIQRRWLPIAGLLLCAALASAAPAAAIRLKVTAELANIRQRPSISSIIIRQVPEGAILEATGKEGEFFLVKLDPDEAGRSSGYVHESLVLVLDESGSPEKKPRVVEIVTPAKPKPSETPVSRPTAKPRTETVSNSESLEAGRAALVVWGGAGFSKIGDINDGAQGLADLYQFQLGWSADQAISPAQIGLQFGAEFQFPIGPRLFLSAGLEYFRGSSASLVTYTNGVTTSTLSVTPAFNALPLKFGFVFYPTDFLYFKIGAMYTFARASYAYHFIDGPFWQDWAGQATAGGLGVYGGLGLEIPAGRTFSFILEASSQFMPVTGLTGSGTFQDSTLQNPATETGTLYSYDGKPTLLDSFPLVFIRSKLPTEGGVENAREAKLDLTGLALRAGIKVKF